jgi:hypothetical protein
VLGLVEISLLTGAVHIENPLAAKGTVSEIFLPGGGCHLPPAPVAILNRLRLRGYPRWNKNRPRTSDKRIWTGLPVNRRMTPSSWKTFSMVRSSMAHPCLQEGITSCRLSRFVCGKMAKISKITSEEWLPVIYHRTGKGEQQDKFGVLSRTDWTQKPARLIMFESAPKASRLEIYIFGNMPQDRVQGELVELQKLQTTSAEIYVAKIMLQHQGTDELSRR